ncbi:MAG: SapC family protein [Burkholderiales bacterium]|nr:SapC family protein [Burkholderiales bacterium]
MIIPELHRRPVALDRAKHRKTVLRVPVQDWTPVARMNALFVGAAEMPTLASEYPILFVKAGQDDKGQTDYAPIAVFGLAPGENLYLEGGRWRAQRLPAQLAMYPLCVARVKDDRYAVCLDESWDGVASEGPGERLFDDAGEPTEFARRMQGTLEKIEAQVQQTRMVGRRLAELDLLRERRFDATLPDGRKLAVDGFFMVDEERFKALKDDQVLALHRDGVLGLIHAHWISANHMRRLLEWRVERERASAAGAAAAPQPGAAPEAA